MSVASSPDLDRELLAAVIHDALAPASPTFTWHQPPSRRTAGSSSSSTDDGETFALIGRPEPGAVMTSSRRAKLGRRGRQVTGHRQDGQGPRYQPSGLNRAVEPSGSP